MTDIPDFVFASPEAKRPEHLYRPHPCEFFQRRFLRNTTKSNVEIARLLEISEEHLSQFLLGNVSVDEGFATKLHEITNISVRSWLHAQCEYDLYVQSSGN